MTGKARKSERPTRSREVRRLWIVGALSVLITACGGGQDAAPKPDDMSTMNMPSAAAQDTADAPGDRQHVALDARQERLLGVVYGAVGRRDLQRTVRTVGHVVVNEASVVEITLKIDGFVEELFVRTTGESVVEGQPLLAIYSPELVSAQEELLTAMRLAERIDPSAEEAWSSAQALVDAAERRLSFWDITDEQVRRLKATREVRKTLTLVSPVTGVVLQKPVTQGQHIRSGMLAYRLADLSDVWVEGDVFEKDLRFVHVGSQAHIEFAAYPGEHLMGEVEFVHPVVDEDSRAVRVRVAMPNPDLRLKPGMFSTMYFDVDLGRDVIAVPLAAVIFTGKRNLVFVLEGDGMLRPREILVGPVGGEFVQVLSGLDEGETIVISANFLIDAESQIGGGMGGMPGMQMGPARGEKDDSDARPSGAEGRGSSSSHEEV